MMLAFKAPTRTGLAQVQHEAARQRTHLVAGTKAAKRVRRSRVASALSLQYAKYVVQSGASLLYVIEAHCSLRGAANPASAASCPLNITAFAPDVEMSRACNRRPFPRAASTVAARA